MRKTTSNESPWKSILAKDIDEYLTTLPEELRMTLQGLRKMIRDAAPEATETIYYRIPTFLYHGALVGFSASKNHCSFHLMSPSLMEACKEELRSYETSAATIRFAPDKPLPVMLVHKLVKERMTENLDRQKNKGNTNNK